MDLIQVSAAFLFLVPVVIAICQVLKKYKYVPSRFIPLVAIALAMVGAAVLSEGNLVQNLFQGLLAGLMAVGTFAGVRSTIQG